MNVLVEGHQLVVQGGCLYWRDSSHQYLWLYTTHTNLPMQYWEWSEGEGVLLGALIGTGMRGVMACVSVCHDTRLVRLIQLG